MRTDPYREGDSAFQAAGGYEGIKQLTDDFYHLMNRCPEFKAIRDLHTEDLALAAEKLALFLSGYFNGPNLYGEQYGQFLLAAFHQHIPIGSAERASWLACMQMALNKQPWEQDFKDHAIRRLRTPAERCRNQP